jgi:hypothetical protein
LDVLFDPHLDIGLIAGVRWLFGYVSYDAVLVHLGPSGEPALTKVPLDNPLVAAVERERIWLYACSQIGTPVTARWTSIDVSNPDRPTTGPVVPVRTGARRDYASAFAVGAGRALLVTSPEEGSELLLLDTATRAVMRAPFPLGKGFLPVRAFCDGDRCAVVAVVNEGGGPGRRLVVVRAAPDGAVVEEQLAPGWVSDVRSAEIGDQVILSWGEQDGYELRALDRRGLPVGPAVAVPWDRSRRIRSDVLLQGDGAVLLALGERDRWSVAPVGPGAALGPFRDVPGAGLYGLAAAPLDDGLAWASVGGDVSYETVGDVHFHTWKGTVVVGFAPASDAGAPSNAVVASGANLGRGGYEVFMLTRPGAAGVLVVPRDDALSSLDHRRFVLLRAPCEGR